MKIKKIFLALFFSLLIAAVTLPNNTLAASVPSAPTNLTATASSSSEIDLTWDAVEGASSYLVYMSVSSSTSYDKIASVNTTSYTGSGLCASTAYYFKVKASNSSGSSAYSSAASDTTELPNDIPETPVNLDATDAGSEKINLSWDAVTDAESYYMYRATSSSGTYSKIATVKTTSYTNTGLAAGKKYYYKVAAYNRFGTSEKSAYASAATETDIPDVPTNLEATALSSSQIKLTWDSVSDATSYYIYRATSSTGSYTKIETVSDESYTNTGLKSSTTYYYKVQAHNSSGTSGYSSRAYAITKSGGTSADAENTYRLGGSDRYATAAKIAEDGWESSDYAVIASGEDFPDALCGAPLAAKYNAPILLTSRYRLEEQTRIQLTRLEVQDVFIIGGTGVISASVEQSIEKLGIDVTRIAGKDRYETALQVAKKIGTFDQAIIATGDNFPDALSIASIAGIKGYPILLTEKYSLPTGLLSYLKSEVDDTIVIGGTGVVSNNVFNQLPSPIRLSGDDRYETNLAIIEYFADSLDFTNCYVATGENFPDTLAGSALAAMNSSPVFIVSNSVTQSMLDYMNDQDIEFITAFGGTGVVSTTVLNKLATKASGESNIPDAPDDLTADAVSPAEIFLDWDAVSNATGYYVYRATSSSGTYAKIDTVKSSSYTDSDLDADTTYYYKVKAYNSYGTSDYSEKVYDTTDNDYVLDTPTNLEATIISSSEISLTWGPVSDAAGYYVYRATSSSGTYSKIATTAKEEYTNTGLAAGKTYYYKVKAYNSDGTSDFSLKAYATTGTVTVPVNLEATALSSSEIFLTWDPVSEADSYYVYRASSLTGTYSKIATVVMEEYTNSGLAAGRTYFYKVKAYKGSSLSDFSAAVNATTDSL